MPKERPSCGGELRLPFAQLPCAHVFSFQPSLDTRRGEQRARPNVLDFEFEQEYFFVHKVILNAVNYFLRTLKGAVALIDPEELRGGGR